MIVLSTSQDIVQPLNSLTFDEVSYQCQAHHFLKFPIISSPTCHNRVEHRAADFSPQVPCFRMFLVSIPLPSLSFVQASHQYVNVDLIIDTYNLVLDLLDSILELRNFNSAQKVFSPLFMQIFISLDQSFLMFNVVPRYLNSSIFSKVNPYFCWVVYFTIDQFHYNFLSWVYC